RTKGVATTVGVRKSLGWVKGDRERHKVVNIKAIEDKITKKVTTAFGDKVNPIGKVYPTTDAMLHGSCLSEGYIKVQVDMVEDAYKAIPVPKTTEKFSLLEHTILEFIEWPRKRIKVEQSVTSKPVKPKLTQEERVKERLHILICKPKLFQDSMKRFTKIKNKNTSIVVPRDMYSKD
nr:ulp1 protease family, C-terminal catalytic domain-containing protein [Tanacetum cinerariifolium]